jgi:hypothetical protein
MFDASDPMSRWEVAKIIVLGAVLSVAMTGMAVLVAVEVAHL